jgi:CubicO group peptidase (beta-lactamase class C family)
VARGATGRAALVPRPLPARLGTVYDLASLTKPLCTASLAVLMARQGEVRLDEPAGERLEEMRGSPFAGASLAELLTHQAGLPAWEPLYLHGADPRSYLERMARLRKVRGHRFLYSDLGYIAAGVILERAAGQPLDRLFRRRVAAPLGALRLRFSPPRGWISGIAPTERGNEHERDLARHLSPRRARAWRGWRQGVLRGVVHDQNAAALGGVAGHAGLFGEARAVGRLGAEFLPGSRLFRRGELRLFAAPAVREGGRGRTLGFEVGSAAAGESLSPRAFGHTGFTGTSLFVDPATEGVFVLLTNRVHPVCGENRMAAIRAAFHDRAARLLAGAHPGRRSGGRQRGKARGAGPG